MFAAQRNELVTLPLENATLTLNAHSTDVAFTAIGAYPAELPAAFNDNRPL